jgi:hypothetical protein
MLIGFEQVALAAIRPLESAVGMRNEKLADTSYRDDKASAKRRIAEADHELAFASSMIAEFVVTSATKPKVWLEDRMHSREGTAPSVASERATEPIWALRSATERYDVEYRERGM